MAKIQKILKKKVNAVEIKKPTIKKVLKIRTKTRFSRPVTKKTVSKPMTIKSFSSELKKKDKQTPNYFQILINPVQSDKVMFNLENRNTIVYQVDPRANKNQIKEAFTKVHKLNVRKVNTLNLIGKGKRAYIRLDNDKDALNLASKIGLL